MFHKETEKKHFVTFHTTLFSFLRIWSHLLKKSIMENFIFCGVSEGLMYVQFTSCVQGVTSYLKTELDCEYRSIRSILEKYA